MQTYQSRESMYPRLWNTLIMYYIVFLSIIIVPTIANSQPWDYDMVSVTPGNEQLFSDKADGMLHLLEDSTSLQWTPLCYDQEVCDSINGWGLWYRDTAIVEHPNFPGCMLLMTYKFRRCPIQPLNIQHYIERWVVSEDTTGSDCQPYLNI